MPMPHLVAVPKMKQQSAPVPVQMASRPAVAPQPHVQKSPLREQSPARVSHQSLYGSLHDDVTVPLTLTAKNIPADPDAPIATVTSVRTKPVETRLWVCWPDRLAGRFKDRRVAALEIQTQGLHLQQ